MRRSQARGAATWLGWLWRTCTNRKPLPAAPRFHKLDKVEDGTLDLRKRRFSGRFRSATLEIEYCTYLFAIWRPRYRFILFCALMYELWAIVDAVDCQCGVRYGMFEGGWLIFTFVFPETMFFVGWVLLSPYLARFIAPHAWKVLATHAMCMALGYLIPAIVYLQNHPLDRPECPETLESVDAALLHLTTLNLMCAMLGLLCSSFGVGSLSLVLFVTLHACLFTYYFVVHTERLLGSTSHALVPMVIMTVAVNVVFAFMYESHAREQYIVRIYAAHEKDMRVTQLQEEKERLDYERRFAIQKAMHHDQSRLPEPRAGCSLGIQLEGTEAGSLASDPNGLPPLGPCDAGHHLTGTASNLSRGKRSSAGSCHGSCASGTDASEILNAAAALHDHPTMAPRTPAGSPDHTVRNLGFTRTEFMREDRLNALWKILHENHLVMGREDDGNWSHSYVSSYGGEAYESGGLEANESGGASEANQSGIRV